MNIKENTDFFERYYFDWTGVEDFSEYQFDTNGIPLVNYGQSIGLQYNPLTIAQFGLFNYNLFLEGNKSLQTKVLSAADWLIHNVMNENHGTVWYYHFDLDFYKTRAPWISAMAQGEAISLLLRAYSIAKKIRYLEVAENAILPLMYPVAEGGLFSTFPDETLCFEEFPSDPPSHVLNGFIFTIFGVLDYLKFFNNRRIGVLYQNALEGLKNNLNLYDTGYWTRYDLYPVSRLASRAYQKIHIQQLNILYIITSDSIFKSYAEKWQRDYYNIWSNFRWGMIKVNEKIQLKSLSLKTDKSISRTKSETCE